ncbi:MAG: hypothetical protein QOK42_2035, partial [Frankiaceae bacterium]|nr:hypothetical protein [Frankiaceae bacterium]
MTAVTAPVRTSVEVGVSAERAFDAFVNHMDDWWPRAHVLHDSPYVTSHIEAGVGGRWLTVHADGAETTVGRVEVWEPPRRLAVSWMISLEWTC